MKTWQVKYEPLDSCQLESVQTAESPSASAAIDMHRGGRCDAGAEGANVVNFAGWTAFRLVRLTGMRLNSMARLARIDTKAPLPMAPFMNLAELTWKTC